MSDRDGDREVFVMNADGTGQIQLTFSAGDDASPAWSPDGSHIAFDGARTGNLEMFVMNADGSGQTQLTFNTAVDANPSWSPDGNRIAFYSDRTGFQQIFVMDADGSGQTQLTFGAANGIEPVWSPDGSKIAFTSHDGAVGSGNEILVMNADGTNQVNISSHPADDAEPDWGIAGPVSVYHVAAGVRSVNPNSSITVIVGAAGVAVGDTVTVSVATGTFAGAANCTDTKGNGYAVVADKEHGQRPPIRLLRPGQHGPSHGRCHHRDLSRVQRAQRGQRQRDHRPGCGGCRRSGGRQLRQ